MIRRMELDYDTTRVHHGYVLPGMIRSSQQRHEADVMFRWWAAFVRSTAGSVCRKRCKTAEKSNHEAKKSHS